MTSSVVRYIHIYSIECGGGICFDVVRDVVSLRGDATTRLFEILFDSGLASKVS